MSWYLAVLKNYAGFSGRARRTEYWMFALFSGIIEAVLYTLTAATNSKILLALYLLYGLAVLIPGLAVAIRRLHDTGRPGGWAWLLIFIFFGWVWLLVLLCLPGQPGPNEYGPDPKAVDVGAEAYAQ